MKKAFLALAAVALLFATSCNKETNAPEDITLGEGEFLATIDNGANPQNAPVVKDGMGTMTIIDDQRYVIWEQNDQIAINGKTYITNTEGNPVAFAPANQEQQAAGASYHAFFAVENPSETAAAAELPATQTIVNGKVSNLPINAYSTTTQLTFHNICVALKIKMPVTCDRIVVTANEAIRGEFTITNGYTATLTDAAKSVDANKTLTVDGTFAAHTDQEPSYVYVAIPAGTYNNFTLEFFDKVVTVNNSVRYISIGGKISQNAITVEVNKIHTVNIAALVAFPIDLGFSVKWAPYNVGANRPSDDGDYYAWGDTEPIILLCHSTQHR